ncbi:hypothetical protein NUW54_g10457 [Trametes sanguinea]|uniref:Uncharacterized protein n=1 Tax=Trametes sanguinea TaxID=158606 RepID=A0ACC1P057_9APHY|nr:hypothetical protein NUW54_g10457 [Trametes sanguinea]
MPPQNRVWELFERRLEGNKYVKYLSDRSHPCAWCTGCVDECVRKVRESELVQFSCGERPSVRIDEVIRGSIKQPGLAQYAATWKRPSNILDDFSGVIPICGKKETMYAHARRCPHVNRKQLAEIGEADRPAVPLSRTPSSNENTPPSTSATTSPPSMPWRSELLFPTPGSPSSGSPSKRMCTVPLSATTSPIGSSTSESPRGCGCDCHAWTPSCQADFAQDLLRFFVMCNIPWNAADSTQAELFFGKWLPGAKIPDRRKLSGSCLDAEVQHACAHTKSHVHGKLATGQSDGWKNIAKTSVITSVMSVEGQAYLVRTHDMSGRPKTGQEHAEVIKADMKHMQDVYDVQPIAWVTDDGPDGKGARSLLRALLPSLMTFVCWGHQSQLLAGDYLTFPEYSDAMSAALDIVRWFNNHSGALELLHQAQIFTADSDERRKAPLALILPAQTRWTTHFQCVARLLVLRPALQACILKNKARLMEIAARSQTTNAATTARNVIDTIEDRSESFWTRLDRVEAHLRPLAIATNILQAANTRLDHVLLTLANLFRMYDSDDVEADVRERMLARIELRWRKGAGKDQDLFILAVFLNPYIRGYCFNHEALSTAELIKIAVNAFTRLFGCAPNTDFTEALIDYSTGKAEFSDEHMSLAGHLEHATSLGTDPDLARIWSLADRSNDHLTVCPGRNGLTKLAIRLLSVIANSAGTERVFSDFGGTHTKMRNRLHTETVHKTSTVRMAARLRAVIVPTS